MARVKGIDSRYWNSIMPPGYDFKWVGSKISQETQTNLNLSAPHKQWKVAKEDLGLNRLPFHFWRGMFKSGDTDPEKHGREQAEFFFEETQKLGAGMGELPPAIDCESMWESPGINALIDICATCERTEQLWGKKPLIYTASWWWNRWITPYHNYNPAKYNPYQYMLWEADPPPDTREPGKWTKAELKIVQEILDWHAPGFNAGIDVDWADETWYNEQIGVVVPPPPPPGSVEIEVIVPPGVSVTVTEKP
jgi:hypothetical protein